MRKSCREAVAIASIIMLLCPSLMAQYPAYQNPTYYPIAPGGQSTTVIQQPVVWPKPPVPVGATAQAQPPQPQQSIAQPSQPATNANVADQVAKREREAQELIDRMISKRVDEIMREKSAKEKPIEKSVDPPVVTTAAPSPIAERSKSGQIEFGDSANPPDPIAVNGIDPDRIPRAPSATLGGDPIPNEQVNSPQQFSQLSASLIANADREAGTIEDDTDRLHVVVIGPKSFEDEARNKFANEWKDIWSKAHVTYGDKERYPQLAWRTENIGLDWPQGILICGRGSNPLDPKSYCRAVHFQKDLDQFPEAFSAAEKLPATKPRDADSDVDPDETYGALRRRNKPIDPTVVPDLRKPLKGIFKLAWWWYVCPTAVMVILAIKFRDHLLLAMQMIGQFVIWLFTPARIQPSPPPPTAPADGIALSLAIQRVNERLDRMDNSLAQPVREQPKRRRKASK